MEIPDVSKFPIIFPFQRKEIHEVYGKKYYEQ
jgi:hypothetical protein